MIRRVKGKLEIEWHSINTRLIEREDMKKTCFCGISEHCGYQIETDMEQHDKVIYEQGYNKAIDDFAEQLRLKCIEDKYNDVHLVQVLDIAKQLKF